MSCILTIKKRIKRLLPAALIIQLIFVFCLESAAQSKWVIENYNYIGQPGPGTIVPMIHFETKQKWYGELRYNYEENQTISFFAGKTFQHDKILKYSITPLIGFSEGNFTGISAGTNAEMSYKKLYMSSQSQYSFSTKNDSTDFFFSWSEIGCTISSHFFAGLAVQATLQAGNKKWEPGFVAGFEIKNFSFPVYVFSPLTHGCYVVAGINFNCTFEKKKRISN